MNDIRSRLLRCFAAVFPQMRIEVIPTLTQDSTEKWDSLATAVLFTVIEQEFGVSLDSEDWEHLDSFARIYDYLCHRTVS